MLLTCVCVSVSVWVTSRCSTIMGEMRDFKFGGYVNDDKSQDADNKPCLKRAWSGSRDQFYNVALLKYLWNG